MSRSVAIIGTRGYPSYYGGFETAVRKLAPMLADNGWDVTVYGRPGVTAGGAGESDPRVRTVITRGIESKSASTLTYGATASAHARRRRPDVALVMNVANGFFLPSLKRAKIPTLVNVDGIEWDREKWSPTAKRVFRWGARLTARYADEIVVDAREIGARWEREFGRQGTFIPYGGEEVEVGVEPPLGLPHRGYVLIVARLVPENTVPQFLEAAEMLSQRWPVVIVGSSGYGGEIEESVTSLTERHTSVRWLGHVKDDRLLHSLMAHAGAYFHGHSVGGTNPALVQAMAAAAPIVARDTVYTREVLGSEGLFSGPEPMQITTAVSDLMADPEEQKRVSAAALARQRETYTWERVNAAYAEALARLAEAGCGRG